MFSVNFQKAFADDDRPCDMEYVSLQQNEVVSLSELPVKGDYITIKNKDGLTETLMVRSRLVSFTGNAEHGRYINVVNIVLVESQADYGMLIKE